MTDELRVVLEIGKQRRVVAGAMDWPGLDRWGTSEDPFTWTKTADEILPHARKRDSDAGH